MKTEKEIEKEVRKKINDEIKRFDYIIKKIIDDIDNDKFKINKKVIYAYDKFNDNGEKQ